MRDRFPLAVAALVALAAAAVWLLGEAGRRGTFAEPMSTYRSAPDGARALFLLAKQLGLAVSRRHVDFRDLTPAKTRALVMLGIWRINQEEATKLQTYVAQGGQLLLVVGTEPKDKGFFKELLQGERSVLDLFGVAMEPCDRPDAERELEVAIASPLVKGVEAPVARVAGYLSPHRSEATLALVLDPHGDDKAVAIRLKHEAGRVVVVSAPDLASNRGLGRGDNARLWASLLGTLGESGTIAFDEFHHGFTGDRSISGYAAKHGLHGVLLQLLLVLCTWIAAKRRFGSPRSAPEEERVAGADYLSAMSRIYRQGGHREHAVRTVLRGLVRDLAGKAGVGHEASVGEVVRALHRRGRPDLARALCAAEAASSGASSSDDDVLAFARTCAAARRLAARPRTVVQPLAARRASSGSSR